MKKILIAVCMLLSLSAQAEIFHANVEYSAESARKAAFANINYKIPKETIKSYIYDKDIEENKNAMKYNLSLPDRDVKLYELPFSKAYGVSLKKREGYTYFYWHSNGYLKAVAIEEKKGKNKFPVTIYRYNPYGDLTGVSFQVSPVEEYIYNRDGTLNCHWVGNVAYDENNKKIGSSQEIEENEK